jgi:hypothetical protein
MNFINPYTTTQSIKDLETYMTENNIENITDLIGAVK